jgi:hypothetical protein
VGGVGSELNVAATAASMARPSSDPEASASAHRIQIDDPGLPQPGIVEPSGTRHAPSLPIVGPLPLKHAFPGEMKSRAGNGVNAPAVVSSPAVVL